MAVTTHKASPRAPAQHTGNEQLASHVKTILKGHKELVSEVAFILGTRLLVSGSGDKSLRVWNLDTEEHVGEPLLGHNCAVWRVTASPDGHWIVSGGTNGSILVWEVATNKRELKRVPVTFKGHRKFVMSIAFAPDSETFASASEDETVCIWKRETGEIVRGPLKVGTSALSVSYSLDGTRLAAGTDNHIMIWNTKTGKELLKIEQRAWRVAFTPNGLHFVSGNLKDIRISDAATGDIIKQFDAHTTEPFHALAIAPNGTKFATTSYDKTTRFFDMSTFKPIGEPLEHPDKVQGLAFSEDSQLIATGCEDKLIRTWTVPLSKSELQQSTEKILNKPIPVTQPHPRCPPIQTSRFFDGFDPHSRRNNRAATTPRNTKGSRIKNTMNRLFSHSSVPQDHTPCPRSIPLVDVFSTRGQYHTANKHTGKRHKLMQQQCPPRQQPRASASSSSMSSAGTSGATTAMLQAGSTNASAATNRPPSPSDIGHVPDTACFAVLTSCFPCLSRTPQTSLPTSGSRSSLTFSLVQDTSDIDDTPSNTPFTCSAEKIPVVTDVLNCMNYLCLLSK